jgi:signal transduction histidine kinase
MVKIRSTYGHPLLLLLLVGFLTSTGFNVFPGKIKGDKKKIDSLLTLSENHMKNNFNMSRQFAREALIISKSLGEEKEMADAFTEIGRSFYFQSICDSAITYFKHADTIYTKLEDFGNLWNIKRNIGLCYHHMTNLSEAFKKFKKNYEIALMLEDSSKIIMTKTDLANIYVEWRDHGKALQAFTEALGYYNQREQPKEIARCYYSIGHIYLTQESYEKARLFFQKMLKESLLIKDYHALGNASTALASVFIEEGKPDSALTMIEEAASYYKKVGYGLGNLYVLMNKMEIFYMQNEMVNSTILAKQVIRKSEELNHPYGKLFTYGIMAKIKQEEDPKEALGYIDSALYMAEQQTYNEKILEFLDRKYKILKSIDSIQAAFEVLEQYTQLKEEVHSTEKEQMLLQAQVKLETAEKEKENLYLKNQNKLREIRLRYTLLSSGLIITLLTIILLLRNKENKKHRLHLENINAEMHDQNVQLEKANVAKNKFFSIIAHDLLNPVGTVFGLARYLDENYDDISEDKKKIFFHNFYQSVSGILHLLENLLAWSRSQENRIEYNPKTIDLRPIVESVKNLLMINAREKENLLVSNIKENTMVVGDPDLLQTIFRNLISNAIKYTKRGKIEISSNEIIINNKKYVNVEVADTGQGIPREVVESLFKNEKISSMEGTNAEKGTGLGLNLVKEFIDKSGSKLTIESAPGEGSTFSFYLPRG